MKEKNKKTSLSSIRKNTEEIPSKVEKNLKEKIDYWKKKLLDLSRRNRLISFKDYKTSTLLLQSSDLSSMFNVLLEDQDIHIHKFSEEEEEDKENGKTNEETNEQTWLFQGRENRKEGDNDQYELIPKNPDTSSEKEITPCEWVPDHSNRESEGRLYNLYLKSRESLREQGINTLFVALAFLHYYDVNYSEEELIAPLILMPVEIQRLQKSFKNKHSYTINFLDEDIQLNPALSHKLFTDFNLKLPAFPERTEKGEGTVEVGKAEGVNIDAWIGKIEKIIEGKERWKVSKEACIGIFNFKKLLMYLDIEKFRDKILSNRVLQVLIGAPRELAGSLEGLPREDEIDQKVEPTNTFQVLDADSSQQVAIETAKKGVSFVIQGPPGTGKSQTIVNIIAELLARKKRVLFVSEKMAALEVVKNRLDAVGLGRYCLELHSYKTNKKDVLHQLEEQFYGHRELETKYSETELFPQLQQIKGSLNKLGEELLALRGGMKMSIYEARGRLAKLARVPDIHYKVENAIEVTDEEFNRCVAELSNIQNYKDEIAVYNQHLWKGINLKQLGFVTNRKLKNLLRELSQSSKDLYRLIKRTRNITNINPVSIMDLEQINSLLEKIKNKPGKLKPQKQWLVRNLSREVKKLESIVENLDEIRKNKRYLLRYYCKEYLEIPAGEILNRFKNEFNSPLRHIKSDYWRERKRIHDLRRSPKKFYWLFSSDAGTREDLGRLIELRKTLEETRRLEKEVRHLFQGEYKGEKIDWRDLLDITKWAQELRLSVKNFPEKLIEKVIKEDESLTDLLKQYNNVYGQGFKLQLQDLMDYFKEDFTRWEQPMQKVEISNIVKWIYKLQENFDRLRPWIEFNNLIDSLGDTLKHYTDLFLKAGYDPEYFVDCYRKKFFESFLEKTENKITQLSGDYYGEETEKFREFDEVQNAIAKKRIVHILEGDKPSYSDFREDSSFEVSILKREFRKKRRHKPLRILFSEIPNLLFILKPCFMMSPLSVVQYIDLEKITSFDTVIFDEASQIMPEDAVSSLIRSRQAIIVGDSQQLPPTRFFLSLDQDLEIEEELEDLESILDEAAVRLGERFLRWHYRSKDESLITFSNTHFYENRLVTFPNSEHNPQDKGIEYICVKDGVYDRGRSRQNIAEAKKVVELVKKHIKSSPNKSLGVVAFSIQQQRAIQDQLEIFRRRYPEHADFFKESVLDEFFVKNLETVQGDERDVIIFSVGYGPDVMGKMTLNFGPINRTEGYKRLNVAITRAKEKVYLVTSFHPEDIDLEDVSNQSVRYLLKYMRYAKEGPEAISREITIDEIREFGSNFEEAVYDELVEKGWDLATQVGSSGYKIDLAVKHPKRKGRFILGIECDGSAYHSSKTARDRDRIRQLVLENLGWNIYRIWSTDWLLNSDREVEKIEERLRAILTNRKNSMDESKHSMTTKNDNIEVTEKIEENTAILGFPEYKIVKLRKHSGGINAFNRAYSGIIKKDIIESVKIESPIHIEVLLKRLAGAWRISRVGANVRRTILRKLEFIGDKKISRDKDIVWYGKKKKLSPVRMSTEEQRPFTFIPLQELGSLAIKLLESGFSVEEDDLILEMARHYGYERTGPRIWSHLKQTIEYLKSIHKIKQVDYRIELIQR